MRQLIHAKPGNQGIFIRGEITRCFCCMPSSLSQFPSSFTHAQGEGPKVKKMDKLTGTFKDLREQIFNAEAIQTSNVVFRMHYVFTVTGLITASVLLSIGQVTFVNS